MTTGTTLPRSGHMVVPCVVSFDRKTILHNEEHLAVVCQIRLGGVHHVLTILHGEEAENFLADVERYIHPKAVVPAP